MLWERAVARLRRSLVSADDLTLLVGVLLGLFVLLTLGPALLGRGVLLDVNNLSIRLPFRALAGKDITGTVVCRGDTIDALPGIAEIKRSLLAGHFPTWAPYEVGGSQLASLPNYAFLTPLAWSYFVLPLWLAPAFLKLTEIVVGITGMVLFLRRLGVSRASSLVAGFVFVTCGFMLMWSNWPHTRVAALIPALFWASERVVHDHRARDVALMAAVVASMLLGGFPAVTLYALTLAAAYGVVRIWVLHRDSLGGAARAVGAAVGGIVLGVGISAVQILPFVADLSLALAGRDKVGRHLPLGAAMTLLAPTERGSCVGAVRYGPWNPIEVVGYVGVAALVLAVVAVASRRGRGGGGPPGVLSFLLWSSLVMFVLIWVGGPLLAALQQLPFFSSNSLTRGQSVFGFLIAVLAGFGLDRLRRDLPPSGPEAEAESEPAAHVEAEPPAPDFRGRWVVLLAALLLVAVTVAEVGNARRDGYLGHLGSSLVVPVLVLAAAILAVVVVRRAPARYRFLGPVVLVVLVVGQGTGFARTMLPASDRDYFYPETPTHEFLQEHLGGDRYGGGDGTMDAPVSDWYHLRTPVGHEFTMQRWKDLLAAADPGSQLSATYSSFSPSLPFSRVERSPVLDQLSVRYWVANPRRPVGIPEPLSSRGRISLTETRDASCALRGGPIRGVRLFVASPMPAAAPRTTPELHVELTQDGDVVGTGAVLLDTADLRGGAISVAVAGEDVPRGQGLRVRVWLSGTSEPRYFAGRGDRISCSALRPPPDDRDRVRLVFADAGGAVYERLDALPRIRWASRSRVVDPAQQVALLDAGVRPGTVLLDDGSTPRAAGRPAEVEVVADERERIAVDVDARGQGYLVVADSIARPGWTATVDGSPARVVPGNHAFAAVPVPAGRHRVELRYQAPGLRAGLSVTTGSLVVTLGLLVGPWWLRRRRADAPDEPAQPSR